MFLQFNDALMYTTPVQSAQYKLNSVLSLAGMKVRNTLMIVQSLLILIFYIQVELNVHTVTFP